MQINGIKFFCTFPGRPTPVATFFGTGPAPCGKTVTHLAVRWHESGRLMFIQQTTDDGEYKEFAYQMSDVFGRVEVLT